MDYNVNYYLVSIVVFHNLKIHFTLREHTI
jgi:hypothetical protein